MMSKSKNDTDLQSLPSIGPSLAKDLRDLGIDSPADLRERDPEEMFADLCELRGQKIDRCVLYSFRCAVYSVTSDDPEPELLKWWNWKDTVI
jgi:hypothetical protein